MTAQQRKPTTECGCEKHDDGSTTWTRECPEHGEKAIMRRLLPQGARVRDVRHPELTGRIKCHEWHSPGHISPMPYNVEWDDNDRAYEAIGGWFWIYAGIDDVERIPDPMDTEV